MLNKTIMRYIPKGKVPAIKKAYIEDRNYIIELNDGYVVDDTTKVSESNIRNLRYKIGKIKKVLSKSDYKTNLSYYREKVGLSQHQLAEKSGVNVRMIQFYEQKNKDINKASALTVYHLANALNVTVEKLLEF